MEPTKGKEPVKRRTSKSKTASRKMKDIDEAAFAALLREAARPRRQRRRVLGVP